MGQFYLSKNDKACRTLSLSLKVPHPLRLAPGRVGDLPYPVLGLVARIADTGTQEANDIIK